MFIVQIVRREVEDLRQRLRIHLTVASCDAKNVDAHLDFRCYRQWQDTISLLQHFRHQQRRFS